MSDLTTVQKGDALLAFETARLMMQEDSLLTPGQRLGSETVYRPIGNGDVEARIKADCRGIQTLFTGVADVTQALDARPLTNFYTKNADAVAPVIAAGTMTIDHPAAAIGQAFALEFETVAKNAKELDGTPVTPEQVDAARRSILGDDNGQKITTEQGQREIAADSGQPYVRRAIVTCGM